LDNITLKKMRKFLDDCYEAILEQPLAISRTLAPSNRPDSFEPLEKASRIILSGSGDSYAVSLFGWFVFAQLGRNILAFEAADVEFFPFRTGDALIAISASGRSTQTLHTIETAKKANIETYGLTDNPKGALVEAVDQFWLTQAHPSSFDISPSSTTTSAMAMLLLAAEEISAISSRGSPKKTNKLIQNAEQSLKWAESWGIETANRIKEKDHIFLLGFGPTYISCQVGMMKLHEYSLAKGIPVHVEEFAHHTKLIVNENEPVIFLPPRSSDMQEYFKTIEKGIREVLRADLFVVRPNSKLDPGSALLETIFLTFPLQFLASYLAKLQSPSLLGWREPHVNAFKIYKNSPQI